MISQLLPQDISTGTLSETLPCTNKLWQTPVLNSSARKHTLKREPGTQFPGNPSGTHLSSKRNEQMQGTTTRITVRNTLKLSKDPLQFRMTISNVPPTRPKPEPYNINTGSTTGGPSSKLSTAPATDIHGPPATWAAIATRTMDIMRRRFYTSVCLQATRKKALVHCTTRPFGSQDAASVLPGTWRPRHPRLESAGSALFAEAGLRVLCNGADFVQAAARPDLEGAREAKGVVCRWKSRSGVWEQIQGKFRNFSICSKRSKSSQQRLRDKIIDDNEVDQIATAAVVPCELKTLR